MRRIRVLDKFFLSMLNKSDILFTSSIPYIHSYLPYGWMVGWMVSNLCFSYHQAQQEENERTENLKPFEIQIKLLIDMYRELKCLRKKKKKL